MRWGFGKEIVEQLDLPPELSVTFTIMPRWLVSLLEHSFVFPDDIVLSDQGSFIKYMPVTG